MPNLPNIEEERRSYAGTFALCAGALLALALWSLVDDLFFRRPWKKYQAELSRQEIEATEAEIAAQRLALDEDPEYQELLAQLAAAEAQLTTGEVARQRADIEATIGRHNVSLGEIDQDLRFVKSEIEEARFLYDEALHAGKPTAPLLKQIDALLERKASVEAELKVAQAKSDDLQGELEEVQGNVASIADQLEKKRAAYEAARQQLVNVSVATFDVPVLGQVTIAKPPVPGIKQVVLEEFDRSKFDTPLARVYRCESCHAAINKAGYEDGENPLKTHPDRKFWLGKHDPAKYGCTVCHAGQGAAVNSTAMAHGEVMFWEHPLRHGADVQASCISCHLDVQGLPGAEQIAHGERLFEQLGCHNCHLVAGGYEDLAKVGPSLRRVGAKLDPNWMVRWVMNPHAIRPRARMPNFNFGEADAIKIVAYLLAASGEESREWAAGHPAPMGLAARPADVARGKELTESLGCKACHAFSPDEIAGQLGSNKDIAPNLSAVAAKVDGPGWFYHWISDPRGYSPAARMPSLRLTPEEARAITAYLMTLGSRVEPLPDLEAHLRTTDNVDAGERLVRKYGCPGCHDIPGMENESRIGVELSSFGDKVLEELFFGDRMDIDRTWDAWTSNKLKDPRIYATKWIEQVMPNFQLDDEDVHALKTFLSSRTDARVPDRYQFHDGGRSEQIVEGRRRVWRYNCTGCHILEDKGGDILKYYEGREAMAPPNLRGEGEKVQAPWLFGFLKAPMPIRPWLAVRMPTFGLSNDETHAVVNYFGALDRIDNPFVYVNVDAFPAEYVTAGKQLMSPEIFDCFSCHQQGDRKPEGPPDGWAPDLALAYERLHPEWVIKWIRDPQALMPGSKMPAFYPDGPPDVLGGNDEEQITALRDYIFTLGNPPPVVAQRPAVLPATVIPAVVTTPEEAIAVD
jgi:mono/diheme cytochrome c family protein